MIRSILFDFDGVILNTVSIKGQAFGELFSELDHGIIDQVIAYHNRNGGMPRFEKIKNMYNLILDQEISNDSTSELCDRYSSIVFERVLNADWIKGCQEFIVNSHKHYQLYIISAAPQEEIKKIVEERKLESFFQEVLGSPKSKVEHIEFILNRYNLNQSEVIFIGDSLHDYTASKKCNIKFLGIDRDSSNIFPNNVNVYSDFNDLSLNNHLLDLVKS